jgi:phosphatidyl-myo-inositol alpha-mannosyltransferase
MKIGFVLDDSLDKADGVQQYILTLGHWLRTERHEVHYLVGHTLRQDIPHVHSLSRNLQAHFNQNRMSTPLPAPKEAIRELLDREQFDVLHVQMPYSPFLAGRIIKMAPPGTAIVGTFHIIPFSWLERVATRLLRLALWRNLRRFDMAFSVSAPARDFAHKSFRLRSKILPNVVHLSQFGLGKPMRRYVDGKVNIVFLGRLVERKGCMHLLKALDYLHQRHDLQRVRILICGKGPLREELEAYVKAHGLGKIVYFVGFISDEKKIDYLATADIAVFPSTGGESFGIVLIEAMAAGSRVVLAGDNVGYRSVMSARKEQLIDPADTPLFAKRLKHFIDSSRAREQVHHWQKEYVKQFDVNVVGEALLHAYKEAIAKRHTKSDNGR